MSELIDLIERGKAIRAQRIAEHRAWQLAEEEAARKERAEDERMILGLLPPPVAKLAEIEIRGKHAYVYLTQPFPGMGRVKIYASKGQHGWWNLNSYEATNPDGYWLRLKTLEEAVAYAAGELEI